MSLTSGTGPFGPNRSGASTSSRPIASSTSSPGRAASGRSPGDDATVDSERTVLVYESGRLPRYAFPAEDVCAEAHAKPEPDVEGYVRVPWNAADRWLEEDEEIIVHLHDPYHRIEVLPSSRRVRAWIRGELVAESSRPRILFETGLPPRYYLPQEDVRMEALEPVDMRTGCAYKGWATYCDAATSAGRVPAVAWSYPEPLREGEQARGLLCFFQERPEFEVELDDVVQESPPTAWSGTAWLKAPWVMRGVRA